MMGNKIETKGFGLDVQTPERKKGGKWAGRRPLKKWRTLVRKGESAMELEGGAASNRPWDRYYKE